LIDTDHYGLVNLIAGKRIVPELMQTDFTGQKLAEEITALLDREKGDSMRKQLAEVALHLGEGDASRRAAERIVKALNEWD
jgi:lipid-A-disaccharide synthase